MRKVWHHEEKIELSTNRFIRYSIEIGATSNNDCAHLNVRKMFSKIYFWIAFANCHLNGGSKKKEKTLRKKIELTSKYFTITGYLECNRNTRVHMKKYNMLMWLRPLWMRWTKMWMVKARTKMEYWFNDWPWAWICLNCNRRYKPKQRKREEKRRTKLNNM